MVRAGRHGRTDAAAEATALREQPLAAAPAFWHNRRSMATRHDSHSAASTAALSSYGYAYAYPFAWRFS
jgi:hypothetical protein